MSNYWQPNIDSWITENSNINNTASFPMSYQYAPNEGEEMFKVHVANFGSMTVREMKEKICEILQDLHGVANNDDGEGIKTMHHQLYGSSEFSNLVAKYLDTIKEIRSHNLHGQERH